MSDASSSCDGEATALDVQLMALLRDSLPAGCLSDGDLWRQVRALQQAPARSYVRVNVSGVPAPDMTAFVQDRAAHLQHVLHGPWSIVPVPDCPHVLCISAPPASEPLAPLVPATRRVIVHVGCAVAVMRGAHVFAPGVLAVEERDHVDADPHLVSVWADVEGTCLRGHRDFTGAVRLLGNGRLQLQRHELFGADAVKGVAVEMTALAGAVQSLPSFDGLSPALFFPQNLPSTLVAVSLDLTSDPALSILDMCASPGGKTSHMAMLAGPDARIVACDKNKGKVAKLHATLTSMGFDRIDCRVQDASRPGLPAASFDRILLDPPCSGFGQRPILFAEVDSVAAWATNSEYQQRMAAIAVHLLKPNGMLMYSTCTMHAAENEGVVAWILGTFPDMKLDPLPAPIVASYGSPGLAYDGLPDTERVTCIRRFWPADRHDSIGFFFARLRKCQ